MARPEWQQRWGDKGVRFELLKVRSRAILASAFGEKPVSMHPWAEHEWRIIANAISRVISLFIQARSVAEGRDAAPRLPSIQLSISYRGLRGIAPGESDLVVFVANGEVERKSMDKRASPKRTLKIPLGEWRSGLTPLGDASVVLQLFVSGELFQEHEPVDGEKRSMEALDLIVAELKAQLAMPSIIPGVFARMDGGERHPQNEQERLWDLRVRFSDFIRRFIYCYRDDSCGQTSLAIDPFTVFFLRPISHSLGEAANLHVLSGLVGYRYLIDEGQRDFLRSSASRVFPDADKAIEKDYLRFPDGLCSWVFRNARGTEPSQVAAIIADYGAAETEKSLGQLEKLLLSERTLMEIPIYDDLPLLSPSSPDGPTLILGIAMPNTHHVDEAGAGSSVAYWKDLEAPSGSSYRLGEQQVVREVAQRVTRQWLSNKLSPASRAWLGDSPIMLKLREEVEKFADSKAAFILLGETGTGKTELAKLIHQLSSRSTKKFLEVRGNTDQLFASDLFGHKKGAFTDAYADRPGILKEANGGTVLINEIEHLSEAMQIKLLKVLDEGRYTPLGRDIEEQTDVRFIVTCNKDILALMRNGHLREDLYERLNDRTLTLPPLRERAVDIPKWAEKFLTREASEKGRTLALTREATDFLCKLPWKGNLRALDKAIKNTVHVCSGPEIGPDDLVLNESEPGMDPMNGMDVVNSGANVVLQSLLGLYGDTVEEKLMVARGVLMGAGVPRGRG